MPIMQEFTLDLTRDICPMTFVKARRLIDGMRPGEEAVLRVSSGEPLENLPRSIEELGHKMLGITPDGEYYLLRFSKV
jgi:TusA-related sulfurtransferase